AKVPARDLYAALEEVRRLRARVSQVFGEWDVIMTPSSAAHPWPAAEVFPDRIDGREVGPRGHAVYTGWVNACGHPGLTVPARPGAQGLPIGVQLIGDLYSEDMLLPLAQTMETAGPGWRWPKYALC
uniref:amidase family protein n=1 Tax=Roseibium sp. TaxID=1936156 RepID=UPI003D100052